MVNNYTYVVVKISEINNVDYDQVLQTSASTVRKNISNTRFILKYAGGGTPSTIKSLAIGNNLIEYSGVKYFTHNQILNVISDIEWVGTQSNFR